MKNYSQSTEQDIIEAYFGNHIGTFCDLGSNDGITLSNTYALALKGWSGLLVEPSPTAFKKLEQTYEANFKMRLCNCAVTGMYEGWVKFYESGEHLGMGDSALLSTLYKEEMKRWEGGNTVFTETMVYASPVATVLAESKFNTFDFFSIDVEGADFHLLPHIDFKKYNTRMICVEWNSKDQIKYETVLHPEGFRLVHRNAENLIFTKIV